MSRLGSLRVHQLSKHDPSRVKWLVNLWSCWPTQLFVLRDTTDRETPIDSTKYVPKLFLGIHDTRWKIVEGYSILPSKYHRKIFPDEPYLSGGRLLVERAVSLLRVVLRPAGEDNEVRTVLLQSRDVALEGRLLWFFHFFTVRTNVKLVPHTRQFLKRMDGRCWFSFEMANFPSYVQQKPPEFLHATTSLHKKSRINLRDTSFVSKWSWYDENICTSY